MSPASPGRKAVWALLVVNAALIGAIGGQIILPDGSLQEAGSIIWRDGSCLGYSRGASPTVPEVMVTRRLFRNGDSESHRNQQLVPQVAR